MSPHDPLPPRFAYVSKRLTRDIRDRAAADNGNFTVTERTNSGELGLPEIGGLSAKLARESKQERREDTPSSLAVEATAVLRRDQRIVALEAVDHNDYFRLTCDLYVGIIDQAFAWDSGTVGSHQEVAVIYGQAFVAGVGRVFLSLFGSPQNLIPEITKAPLSIPTPSDADGLYRLLEAARELNELPVQPRKLNDHRQNAMSDEYRVQSAASTLRMISTPLPARRWDVLGQAFWVTKNQEVDFEPNGATLTSFGYQGPTRDHFDLAIVGTAIWAGVPERMADPRMAGNLDKLQQAVCDELEEEVFRAAFEPGDVKSTPEIALADDDQLRQIFVAWFFNNAERAGAPIARLFRRRKRSWLNPKRITERPELPAEPSDVEGVVISYDSDKHALISAKGTIYLVERLFGIEAATMNPDDWAWDDDAELTDEVINSIYTLMWQFSVELRQRPHPSFSLSSLPLYARQLTQDGSETG